MALSQKHRSSLYLTLSPVVGTEEAEALLQEFPASDLETPATKDFVRADGATTRAELRQEIADLRTELHSELRRQTKWMVTLVVAAYSASSAFNAWVMVALSR